jgi:hypothetical protein
MTGNQTQLCPKCDRAASNTTRCEQKSTDIFS